MGHVNWVVEEGVFGEESNRAFREAARSEGHGYTAWDDEWWSNGKWDMFSRDSPVVFRGSLANAATVRREIPWRPGAYCNLDAFSCSAYYPGAAQWILNRQWQVMPAKVLLQGRPPLAGTDENPMLFVRPDSCLKQFSGRVARWADMSWKTLDYGFYFSDEDLPVMVAPARPVGAEYRIVVVRGAVVTGSAYEAASRAPSEDDVPETVVQLAKEIAAKMPPPDDAYVMDICEAEGRLWLLELNPFSGAELYGSNPASVVRAVGSMFP